MLPSAVKNLWSFFVLLHIFVHEYLQTQYAFFHCLSVQFYFGIYDFKTNLSLSRLAGISEIKEDPTVKYSLVNTFLCLRAISMWLNCKKKSKFLCVFLCAKNLQISIQCHFAKIISACRYITFVLCKQLPCI